jgi:5-methyltetrahydrofolate--homocysteine methyltransferase
MTETVVTSAKKKVVLGFDQRFVMIGERINPTGRKLLAEEMARGDYSRVVADEIGRASCRERVS